MKKELYAKVCEDLQVYGSAVQKTDRMVTEQDKGVVALLEPKRLLDLTKNHVIYDAGIKKVMRYQQYFAVAKMLMRVEEIEKDKLQKGI